VARSIWHWSQIGAALWEWLVFEQLLREFLLCFSRLWTISRIAWKDKMSIHIVIHFLRGFSVKLPPLTSLTAVSSSILRCKSSKMPCPNRASADMMGYCVCCGSCCFGLVWSVSVS